MIDRRKRQSRPWRRPAREVAVMSRFREPGQRIADVEIRFDPRSQRARKFCGSGVHLEAGPDSRSLEGSRPPGAGGYTDARLHSRTAAADT
jgi:hypothetical protein